MKLVVLQISIISLILDADIISAEQLRTEQGIYLVNNIMDLSKLKQFYQPPRITDEWIRCYHNIS